jgi:hypothetical protein
MATDKRTDTEKFDDAVEAALLPNGPAVKDRDPDGEIHVGPTDVNTADVQVVDAGYDVPEVHIRNLDRRHPDENVGVVVPAEGLGSLGLPIHDFLNAERVEDVFDRDGQSDEDDSPEPAPAPADKA